MTPQEVEHLRGLAKEALRKRLAALRRSLTAPTRQTYAERMCALLSEHEAFQRAHVVLAYSALRFEIDPRAAIERAWALGKTVALPRTLPETHEITPHVYRAGDELAESGFVIQEPLIDAPEVDPSAVQLVLLPGLGFDPRGQRLGFGQGYYDRLLPRLPNAVRIGLAYELSLLPEIPNAAHDIPVDYVITERRVLRCVR
jgi:5-formyltetrahydrofolate cyclo-ligase